MALGLLTLCALISGCYGAFTKTPADTNLFPRSTLRLNCASNIATPVAWYWYVADSNTRRTVFINDAIHPTYSAMFNIDRSDGGYDLVARSTADSSYCGLYQCVEDNGGIDSIANATVSVSTRPVCDVDKLNASASDYVTYSCNATSRCIGGSVPLVIQQDGTRRTAGNNLVHWKTEAGNIAFANITCSSVAVCPRVIVTGTTPTSTTPSSATSPTGCDLLTWFWCCIRAIIAVSSVEVVVSIIALIVFILLYKKEPEDDTLELALSLVPKALLLALSGAVWIISATYLAKTRNEADVADVLEDVNLQALLIGTLVLHLIVFLAVGFILYIDVASLCKSRDKYFRKHSTTRVIAVIVAAAATIISVVTAIWSVMVGQNVKYQCPEYEGEWTWLVLVIALAVSGAAGLILILVLVFRCFRGRVLPLNSKLTDDSLKMKPSSSTGDANGTPQVIDQNDANETGIDAYKQPQPITDDAKAAQYVNADELSQITDQNDANKMAEREAQGTKQRPPNTVSA